MPLTLKHYRRSFLTVGVSALVSSTILLFSIHSHKNAAGTPPHPQSAQATLSSSSVEPLSLPFAENSNSRSTKTSLTAHTEQNPNMGTETLHASSNTATDLGPEWTAYTVQANDNLATIFKKLHLPAKQLQAIANLQGEALHLKKIKPKQTLAFKIDAQHHLQELRYSVNLLQTLHLTTNNNAWSTQLEAKPTTTELITHAFSLQHHLDSDAKAAGLPAELLPALSKIFSTEINFKKNLHKGDRIAVTYEEIEVDHHPLHPGAILAAEIVDHDSTFQAVRYSINHQAAYYDAAGHNLAIGFLRAPVHYTRVSSPFSLSRMHPLLHIRRPHMGVDLAAPTGTPVRATSDGVVRFIGWESGYGNTIIIQHLNHFSTLYGHMEKFAAHLHRYANVKMGQVIGYVGQTGLTTGPHVHYEVRIDRQRFDPFKIKLPDASPIPAALRPAFLSYSHPLLATLEHST